MVQLLLQRGKIYLSPFIGTKIFLLFPILMSLWSPERLASCSEPLTVIQSSDRTGVRCSIPVKFAAVNAITFGHSELQNCEITLATCVIASSGISG